MRVPIRLAAARAKPRRLVAGLMTGTSMDGLDIAVVEVEAGAPGRFALVASAEEPFPTDLRRALAPQGELSMAAAAELSRALGVWYADSVERLVTRHGLALDLVGLHGQTVHHVHGRTTVQLGEPSFLALRLGCPVVADFRQADIAAGGCGAPLVPIVDAWLLGELAAEPGRSVVALNLGGIANLTLLRRDDDGGLDVQGFDVGPGNMVLDALASWATGGAQAYDRDGLLAARGRADEARLAGWLDHPFLALPPPRSAGREEFGAAFVQRIVARAGANSEQARLDLIATAMELTVRPIRDAIRDHAGPPGSVVQIVVSGGGVRNPVLMRRLAVLLAPATVVSSDTLGVPAQLKEPIAFALLASARLDEMPANLPSVTGASRQVLLGKIVEA